MNIGDDKVANTTFGLYKNGFSLLDHKNTNSSEMYSSDRIANPFNNAGKPNEHG